MRGVAVSCDDGQLTVTLTGWRRLAALQRGTSVPLAAVVSVDHDPAPRSRVGTGPRPPRSRSSGGLWRYGTYHGVQGWSFWAVGSGKGAVVVEAASGRYRFVVVEVDDPAATVAEIERARRDARAGGHG